MDKVRARQLKIGAAIGLIFAAQLFLFVPFSLYVGNAGEFAVPFEAAMRVWLPLGLLLAGCVMVVTVLLRGTPCRVYLCLVATIIILMWIQANLLVWDYGPLDGRNIDWTANAWKGWFEVSLWLVSLAFAIVAYRHFDQFIVRTAIVLFFLQISTFTYAWVQNSSERSRKLQNAEIAPLEEIFRFSSHKNVVHIIADGFQSDIFDELINEEGSGPHLRAALDGFTFFRQHLGVFPYTHMTIPAFLSGKIYRNHLPREEYMASTVGGKSILSVAKAAGYMVDVAVPVGGPERIYRNGRYSNFYPISDHPQGTKPDRIYTAAAKLLDLTLFRISPHFVKEHIYNDQLWLVQSLFVDKKFMGIGFFAHSLFLNTLSDQMSADRPEPVYKLIHVMLSHTPFVSTKRCTYAGGVQSVNREAVKNQSRCGLVQLLKLLEKMKALNIYDDATIVIMGDHGAWVPPKNANAIVSADRKTADYIVGEVIALSVPLLAIKRPKDSGPLKVSEAPSWIVDTAATIADVAGLEAEFDGESVFNLDGDQSRERRFHHYTYSRNEWSSDYLAPIEEFSVNGSPLLSTSWRQMATHHPGGQVERSPVKSKLWRTVTLK